MILTARSTGDLQQIAKTVEGTNSTCKVLVIDCDVADNDGVKQVAKSIKDQVGRLDVVVADSAFSAEFTLKVTEGDPKTFQKTFDTKLMGTCHVAHHLLPLLLSTAGGAKQFIAIGSIAAWMTSGSAANTEYTVSKSAQARLVEMIAEQHKREGLLTVTVHPGAVRTGTALKLTPKVMHPGKLNCFSSPFPRQSTPVSPLSHHAKVFCLSIDRRFPKKQC